MELIKTTGGGTTCQRKGIGLFIYCSRDICPADGGYHETRYELSNTTNASYPWDEKCIKCGLTLRTVKLI